MKLKSNHFLIVIALFTGLLFSACEDHQARYEPPTWLGGTSIETLVKLENYTIFLRLMEKANYKEPISKQLFTLFVPDDAAFNKYFQDNGIASIESLTEDESVQLFTLHVLRNPRSRYHLIYEYKWSEEQGPDGEYASLFFRKPTPSTSIPYKETVRYDQRLKGQEVNMYTGDKLVPLFSIDYFEDFFGALDGSDYLFMYPNSTWDTSSEVKDKAMNWHNARVLPNPDRPNEMEVRTASGFIFFIDQVVPPMPSMEEYLIANQDRFGYFYDLMQRFATYGNTDIDENNIVYYQKSYDLILNLAEERGPNTGNEAQMLNMFTAFVPNDAVLENYFNTKILNTYGELDNVPRITLYYILQTQLSRNLGLISKLEKSYFNAFGDPTEISKNDIESAYMCSNGLLYESNRVLEPNVFTCVPGKLFFDKNYSIFLYMLNATSMLTSLSSEDQKVTLFAPTNAQLEANNWRYDAEAERVEFKGRDNKWRNANANDYLNEFVQDHIYYGVIPELNGEGYLEMSSGNYISYSNNSIRGAKNIILDDQATIVESIPNEKNGILHSIDNAIKGDLGLGRLITEDTTYTKFAKALKDASLLRRYRHPVTYEIYETLKFFTETKKWTAFIPDNQAMAQAELEGLVPLKADRDSLQAWCLQHFVRNNIIFDDGNITGTGIFSTSKIAPVTVDGPIYVPVTINNTPGNMTVKDKSGQVISVDNMHSNKLARNSVVHTIGSVFKN